MLRELINNVAVLLVLGYLYRLIARQYLHAGLKSSVLSGMLFGGIAIIGMMNTVTLAPGIVFDARSVIVSVGALFTGPVSAIVMAAIAGAYRLWMGGSGAHTGVGVILTSSFLGVCYFFLRHRYPRLMGFPCLYLFGVLVHAAMLLWMLALPSTYPWQVLRAIALPVMATFPLATVVFAKLLTEEEEQERRKLQLIDSQQRSEMASQAANVGFWDWILGTGEVRFSREWKGQLGYQPHEIPDAFEEWEKRLHPDDHQGAVNAVKAFLANPSGAFESEFRLRHKDGSYRWILARGNILRDRTGKPCRMLGCHVDFTERRHLEAELENRARQHERWLQSSFIGVVINNAEGVAFDGNAAFLRMTGYTKDDLRSGRVRWDRLTPPEFDHLDREGMAETAAQGHFAPFEKELCRKDGARVPVIVGGGVLSEDQSEFIVFVVDLTIQKQAESAVRESEERFRNIAQSMADWIWEVDANGVYTYASRNVEAVLGYTADEIIGKTPFDIIAPEDTERVREQFLAVAADRQRIHDLENWNFAKDGSRVCLLTNGIPRFDDQGGLLGYRGVDRDITQRKKVEEELANHRERLQELVDERTAELSRRTSQAEKLNAAMVNLLDDLQVANERLLSASRKLRATNEELDAFAYSVSHDLRAPLRHITGFVDLLQKGNGDSLDPKGQRHLNIIGESAERMGNLIDDLLAFSRTGRTELHKAKVDLGQLVKEVVKDAAQETKGRAIVWETAPLPEVRADRATIRQVLVNLVGNALKYTRTRPEARIQIGCAPARNDEVVVFVRDNGVGFDMAYVDKLFGVFQRLHSADEFEGTGIGLANVQRIIHRHGGRTWAEGVVDEGATFYFSLPAPKGTRDS
jgi:PAS domain S-box-containing protein